MGYLAYYLANPIAGLLGIFWLWMLIDAARRGEWLWFFYMLVLTPVSAMFYFFMVYRSGASGMQGFELPGAARRHRIKELQGLIHNLDKPHHYLELGDIYFQKGDLKKAEENYKESLARDARDIDARAHYGQCLLRQNRAAEAKPLLQEVCAENPKHDYGYSMMAYAETLTALGDTTNAVAVWNMVLADHGYARARVQLGELYVAAGRRDEANALFQEVIHDDKHAPPFQRRRERPWVRRAKQLLK